MKNNYKFIFTILLFVVSNGRSIASCTAPSTSAGTPVLSCQSATAMTVTWTAAGNSSNCNGYVVVRRTTAAGTFFINDGTALPTAGTTVTFASQMNCYIEYVGNNLSTVSNVTAGTQYYYYIIPFNNAISACSPAPAYRTSSIATVTNTIPVVGAISNCSNGTPTLTTIPNISFTPPTGGADGYIVCTNPNGYYSRPANNTVYNIGDTFNNGSGSPWDQTVQYVGTATSGITAATNLTPGHTYSIIVYPYRSQYTCSGGPIYQGTIARTSKDGIVMATNVGLDHNYNNKDNNHSFFIYPNPAENQLSVYSLLLTGKSTLNIYNVLGEKIFTASLTFQDGQSDAVDVSSFAKGIYYLQITTNSTLVTSKFVKQ